MYTDHGMIAHTEYLPLDRVKAKHYHWHTELTQGGTLLLYHPGTGALHRLPGVHSRNPELAEPLESLQNW